MTKQTILFLAANPAGTNVLALGEEARAIHLELERSGHGDRFALETRWAVRPLDLLHELGKLKPAVVHFSGHGGSSDPGDSSPAGATAAGPTAKRDAIVDPESPDAPSSGGGPADSSGLFFQGPDGLPQIVTARSLTDTFGAAGASVKLVVLSACYSKAQAEALRNHVDCVVGVKGSIGDAAARGFAIGFYGGLGNGDPAGTAFRRGCAAIRLMGLSDADQPQLETRTGVDADRLVLGGAADSAQPRETGRFDDQTGSIDPAAGAAGLERAANRADHDPKGPRSEAHADREVRATRWLFLTLLAAVAVLAVLFGSGQLHQEAVSEYVVFVLLGGLASALTFGLLPSGAEHDATPRHTLARLAASFVPLALIVVGGLWSTGLNQSFAFKIKFVDDDQQSVNVSGSARLEISGYTVLAGIDNADLVTFEHIPRSLQGKTASLTLDARGYRMVQPRATYTVVSGGLSDARVKKVAVTTVTGTLTFHGARLPGGSVSIAGTDCSAPIRDGYFEIQCNKIAQTSSDSAHGVRLQIQVPDFYRAAICNREFDVPQLHDNQLVLAECGSGASPSSGSNDHPPPPPPKVCKIDRLAIPNPWTGERCTNPMTESGDQVTANYKRRFPALQKGCSDVVVYFCPP